MSQHRVIMRALTPPRAQQVVIIPAIQVPRSVCAWCHAVLREGTQGAEITHTICPKCSEVLLNG